MEENTKRREEYLRRHREEQRESRRRLPGLTKGTDYSKMKYEPETFYHGTGVSRRDKILRRGFKGDWTYITPDRKEAEDYVRMAPETLGEPGVVMEVRVLEGAETLAEWGMDSEAYPSKAIIPI